MTQENENHVLRLESVAKAYGATEVLSDVNVEVSAGDFYVISGQPSSGKSVLLRLILGLESPDSGSINLRGETVTDEGPQRRNIGYVPQSFALFPNKSVRDNITYPMRLDKASKKTIEETLERVTELLNIKDLLDKRPDQLSGGQKQRVAIARGLAKETDIFVLDDPLVGLDFKLRERLIDDLKKTRAALGVTFIYSTSDALEVLLLASRVGVLSGGTIMEEGELDDVYDEPGNSASMASLGFPAVNFLDGVMRKSGSESIVECAIGSFPMMSSNYEGPVVLGIRPEHIDIQSEDTGQCFSSKVLFTEDVGGSEIIYVESNSVRLILVLGASNPQLSEVRTGEFAASVRPEHVVAFDPITLQRISRGKESLRV
jgi:ABC-type sugar transport system ATPase subunit